MSRIPVMSANLLTLGLATSLAAPLVAHAQKPVLTTLHRFNDKYGATPVAAMTLGTDGNFYGTTEYGGVDELGTVFKMTPDGHFTTLYQFHGADGANPNVMLTLGKDGAFYGATNGGGNYANRNYGGGTLFRITPQGQLTTLYKFSGPDGFAPNSPLLPAADGSFYGTTYNGGSASKGTLFHFSAGTVTTLHTFTSKASGDYPEGAITFGGPDGGVCGTTYQGGTADDGILYEYTQSGVFHMLRSFTGPDGRHPAGGIVAAPGGLLYGTAQSGGTNDRGVVFTLAPSGLFTVLHSFDKDSSTPVAPVTIGGDGTLYGTTTAGGTFASGTVYSLTPDGMATILYTFHTPYDGKYPYGGVTFVSSGSLYGITASGGYINGQTTSYGTIYKLTLP